MNCLVEIKIVIVRILLNELNGLGHLMRCLNLIKPVISNYKIIFLVDTINHDLRKLLDGIEVIEIYNKENKYQNATLDAENVHNILSKNKITKSLIVIDDYRIDEKWISSFEKNNRIMVIDDDTKREIKADIVLDYKVNKIYNKYKNIKGREIKKLFGHKYNLVSKIKKLNSEDNFILITMGGSLKDEELMSILDGIIINQDRPHSIKVILSPFANKEIYLEKYSKKNSQIIFLQGVYNKSEIFKGVTLYIGPPSTMFYEATYLKIPAILISISPNQTNEIKDIERYGQYLYFNNINLLKNVSELINCILSNYKRFKKLIDNAEITLDGEGPIRVWSNLLYGKSHNHIENYIEMEYGIYPVDDSHINNYLNARNNISNSKFMNVRNTIDNINHYIWWFNNSRNSFFLGKKKQVILYIWEQIINFENNNYLIGGWFTATDNIEISDIFFSIENQLKRTNKLYPNIPWIAIINKNNKFVQVMNKRFGFYKTNDKKFINVANKVFNLKNSHDFEYWVKQ